MAAFSAFLNDESCRDFLHRLNELLNTKLENKIIYTTNEQKSNIKFAILDEAIPKCGPLKRKSAGRGLGKAVRAQTPVAPTKEL